MILLDFQFGSLQICCGFTAARNNQLEKNSKTAKTKWINLCEKFLGL